MFFIEIDVLSKPEPQFPSETGKPHNENQMQSEIWKMQNAFISVDLWLNLLLQLLLTTTVHVIIVQILKSSTCAK